MEEPESTQRPNHPIVSAAIVRTVLYKVFRVWIKKFALLEVDCFDVAPEYWPKLTIVFYLLTDYVCTSPIHSHLDFTRTGLIFSGIPR